LNFTVIEEFDKVQFIDSVDITADRIPVVVERIKLELVDAFKLGFLSGLDVDEVACLECIADSGGGC
jgi:hypothetical protein